MWISKGNLNHVLTCFDDTLGQSVAESIRRPKQPSIYPVTRKPYAALACVSFEDLIRSLQALRTRPF